MKIKRTDVVVESSFSRSRAFNQSCRQIRKAIRSITWGNEGDGRFIINPTRDGNGVVPLTDQIEEAMQEAGWSRQQFRDREARVGAIDFVSPDGLVGFEFDTGNMSSAYRSPVKLLSLLRGKKIRGAVIVIPTQKLERFLTARIARVEELVPHYGVFKAAAPPNCAFAVMAFEQDGEDLDSPLMPKRYYQGSIDAA